MKTATMADRYRCFSHRVVPDAGLDDWVYEPDAIFVQPPKRYEFVRLFVGRVPECLRNVNSRLDGSHDRRDYSWHVVEHRTGAFIGVGHTKREALAAARREITAVSPRLLRLSINHEARSRGESPAYWPTAGEAARLAAC